MAGALGLGGYMPARISLKGVEGDLGLPCGVRDYFENLPKGSRRKRYLEHHGTQDAVLFRESP